jgi:rhamnosyltransferase
VCAVVVTFNPALETLANLELLLEQVEALVVVDNGSRVECLDAVRRLSEARGFGLLENEVNLGIAAALNRGARYAIANGFRWVALFDQDSAVTPGFFAAMFEGVETHRRRDKVAIFCPRYVDRESGRDMAPAKYGRGSGLLVGRTSGSLMRAPVFEECGWFVEEMVIDQVDFEYCLRVRRRGYEIAECRGATLVHTLGAPQVLRLFGVRLFGTTNHSAARRYYLARNRTWLLKKYWVLYPRWCSGLCVLTLKESAKILIVEDRRWSKLGHILLGLRDGAIGRMGMTVKL